MRRLAVTHHKISEAGRGPAFSFVGTTRRNTGDYRLLDRRVDLRRAVPLERRAGTFLPFRRASESPMAIACLRLFTVLPLRPLFNVPFLRRLIALWTVFEAPREYLAMSVSLKDRG